ncbi:MAG TPA: hypothetical protein VFA20_31345 [Myxococcaceae bacterium]|nr:hypothetical protein [Myxococcaceae bacterium]
MRRGVAIAGLLLAVAVAAAVWWWPSCGEARPEEAAIPATERRAVALRRERIAVPW